MFLHRAELANAQQQQDMQKFYFYKPVFCLLIIIYLKRVFRKEKSFLLSNLSQALLTLFHSEMASISGRTIKEWEAQQ